MHEMSSIQDIALKKGLALMNAAGAKYIVIDVMGFKHTNNDTMILAEKKEVVVRKRSNKYPRHYLRGIYQASVRELTVGGMWNHDSDSHEMAEDIRSAATAFCVQKFGKGACMSTVTGRRIEILRVQ
jgi:hypothetical protein